MRIGITAIGRMKDGPERQLVSRYLERGIGLGRSLGLSGFTVSELAESRASSADSRKAEEAKAVINTLPEKSVLIALDERGKTLSSEVFCTKLRDWRDAGRPALTFLIGGADGLDPSLREKADLVLSFSPMTWPHQLVRIMAAEQLYRCTTILSGHPYHRGD